MGARDGDMKLHRLHTGVIITHIDTITGISVKARHPKDIDYIVWELLYRTQEFYSRFK
jgi:hypothetical protein